MNDSADIKRALRPLLKRWWVLVLGILWGLWRGGEQYRAAKPVYQARATIQLNDKETSLSKFLEDWESFSIVNDFLDELALLRSPYLIRKAIQELPVKLALYREGPHRKERFYREAPIHLDYQFRDSAYLDTWFRLSWRENGEVWLEKEGLFRQEWKLSDDLVLELSDLSLKLSITPGYAPPAPGTDFSFIVYREESLINYFLHGDHLMVRLQDEKVAIINIYTWHEVPALAAEFANTLARVYITTFVEEKLEEAEAALAEVQLQTELAEGGYIQTERDWLEFVHRIGRWDLRMEKDILVDEIIELETQRLNLNQKTSRVEALTRYLAQQTSSEGAELNYGAVSGDAFKESLEAWEDLRKKRLQLTRKYTDAHPEMIRMQEEIDRAWESVRASVNRTYETLTQQLWLMDKRLRILREGLADIPQFEHQFAMYERKVEREKSLYESLLKKQIFTAISVAADMSFHRILEHDIAPLRPIMPRRHIYLGLFALRGLFGAITLIYLFLALRNRVRHPSTLEEFIRLPLWGSVETPADQGPEDRSYVNLATEMLLLKEHKIWAINAPSQHELKRAVSFRLAEAIGQLGYQCLWVEADPSPWEAEQIVPPLQIADPQAFWDEPTYLDEWIQPDLRAGVDMLHLPNQPKNFLSQLLQSPLFFGKLDQYCSRYDIILVHMPSLTHVKDAVPLMGEAHQSLLILEQGVSKKQRIRRVEKTLAHYRLDHISWLWVGQATPWWKTWFLGLLKPFSR